VVASEVRSLAQRSSHAAKEIKDLIEASVSQVQAGSTLAGEAGQTMSEVTQAVARVTRIVEEIAAASGEQNRGIEQVNQAIVQIDQVTQQNASLVHEAAMASKSLEEQGRLLTEAVAFFKLPRVAWCALQRPLSGLLWRAASRFRSGVGQRAQEGDDVVDLALGQRGRHARPTIQGVELTLMLSR
jgi:hypothetical protein